jgi:hypothetical protein
MMPDMTGYDFVSATGRSRAEEHSGGRLFGGFDIREPSEQMGAAAWAQKPIVISRLMELIRKHCLVTRRVRPRRRRTAEAGPP